jgi:hypothetical protein
MHRRKFVGRVTAFGLSWAARRKLLTAGILPLGAVVSNSAQGAPRRGGTLRVGVSRVPNNLNPLRHGNQAECMLGEMFTAI